MTPATQGGRAAIMAALNDVNDTEPESPRDVILDEIVNLVAAGCDCSTRPNSQEACETCTREAEAVTDTILARLRLNQRHGNGWSCIDDGNPCARADAGNCEHRYATTWWETPTMTTGANL